MRIFREQHFGDVYVFVENDLEWRALLSIFEIYLKGKENTIELNKFNLLQ